jgi:hypothetical protein
MVEENGHNLDGQAPESTDWANYFVSAHALVQEGVRTPQLTPFGA